MYYKLSQIFLQSMQQINYKQVNKYPEVVDVYHVYSTQNTYEGPMTQNTQRIFVFKETSFPTHECEGATLPKQLALFFLPLAPAPW